MKITVLSHDLSTNAGRRTHRLAGAAGTFADVKLIGPASRSHRWLDLPDEPGIFTVRKRRWPDFHASFVELVEAADGDVLIAVKPHLASFAVALVASELRGVPVILDIDDLDVALAPRSRWPDDPAMTDLSRPKSPLFVSLLTRATGAADAVTVCCHALRERFGGTVVPQPVDTDLFDPGRTDRERARREFGFDGPTVLFPGVPRPHKGLELLADAVARIPGARLAVTCRPEDLAGPRWAGLPITRVGMVPYPSAPALYAAADVVAIPQLDDEAAHHQMPLKAVDAMAMGRPIVASAVSDLPRGARRLRAARPRRRRRRRWRRRSRTCSRTGRRPASSARGASALPGALFLRTGRRAARGDRGLGRPDDRPAQPAGAGIGPMSDAVPNAPLLRRRRVAGAGRGGGLDAAVVDLLPGAAAAARAGGRPDPRPRRAVRAHGRRLAAADRPRGPRARDRAAQHAREPLRRRQPGERGRADRPPAAGGDLLAPAAALARLPRAAPHRKPGLPRDRRRQRGGVAVRRLARRRGLRGDGAARDAHGEPDHRSRWSRSRRSPPPRRSRSSRSATSPGSGRSPSGGAPSPARSPRSRTSRCPRSARSRRWAARASRRSVSSERARSSSASPGSPTGWRAGCRSWSTRSAGVALALVVVVGVLRASAGAISIGELIILYTYARRIDRPLRGLARTVGRASRSLARAERIAEILASDELVEDRPGSLPRRPRARRDRASGRGVLLRARPSCDRRAVPARAGRAEARARRALRRRQVDPRRADRPPVRPH